MTRETIMALAREAGFREWHPDILEMFALPSTIERFAALIMAAQKENV
jgi:hypothetical protein